MIQLLKQQVGTKSNVLHVHDTLADIIIVHKYKQQHRETTVKQ